ncbi:hypothetical protein BC826DRAFT_1177455 [Russula brevipes]|nr:hypothetical protein BC826DRAFT_1177455 [Russula brevipes]
MASKNKIQSMATNHFGFPSWRVYIVFAIQQRIEAAVSMTRPGRASHASRPHWSSLAVQPLRVAMAVLALQPMLSLAPCNPTPCFWAGRAQSGWWMWGVERWGMRADDKGGGCGAGASNPARRWLSLAPGASSLVVAAMTRRRWHGQACEAGDIVVILKLN